ncbi:mechanosensitive ion channel domain-containing protein, partial [uncultured Dubosiella sp.]
MSALPSLLIKLAYSGLIVFLSFLIGPKIKRIIEKCAKNPTEMGAMTFIGSLCSIGTKTLGIIVALGQMGVDTTVIVGAFSALGLGISLALKNNMANVAGGLQIILTKP